MWIKRIKLKNFRSHNLIEVDLENGLNVIVGPNASGKTNLADGLYFFLTGESFQGLRAHDLVKKGEKEMMIEGDIVSNDGCKHMVYYWSDEKGFLFKVNKRAMSPKEIIRKSAVMEFSPDDLGLVKGDPETRRKYLDQTAALLSINYRDTLRVYYRVLKQRNKILKEKRRGWRTQLETWTDGLVKNGSQIILKRNELVEEIDQEIKSIVNELGISKIETSYKSSVNIGIDRQATENNFLKKLDNNIEREIRHGRTESGPHLDDMEIYIKGLRARTHSSQGEKRIAALALKEAAAAVLKKTKKEETIIIMDDILSELDIKNREKIKTMIEKKRQTILTTTSIDYLNTDNIKGVNIINL